jgi:ankyrin repeat protein
MTQVPDTLVTAFIDAACVPLSGGHASGTLERAEALLSAHPELASASVHTAAILGEDVAVRRLVEADVKHAILKGGPREWDALTHLCFSRYLHLDPRRSEGFVRTARALLEAGANPNTGWYETIDYPNPRAVFESAIYGAAGIARNVELTRLLLEFGADPNDEETPYHVPEGYDNEVMQVLLESGRFDSDSLACLLARKADWHDLDGLAMVLRSHGNPNLITKFGHNALHHALRRDNSIQAIEMLLDAGADPAMPNTRDGRTPEEMAAARGRGDVLRLFQQRGFGSRLRGVDQAVAACALGRSEGPIDFGERGGTLLAEFASNGNVQGVACLLEAGVPADALYERGDPYFDIAENSTALHVAAWRAWPAVVKVLLAAGTPAAALDGKGRTALELAEKASESYWKRRWSSELIELLKA